MRVFLAAPALVALLGVVVASAPPPAALASRAHVAVEGVAPGKRRVSPIPGPRLLHHGGTLTISGSQTPEKGVIVVSRRWGARPWIAVARIDGRRRSFTLRFRLTRRGVLRIRIAYPDGSLAAATYHVR